MTTPTMAERIRAWADEVEARGGADNAVGGVFLANGYHHTVRASREIFVADALLSVALRHEKEKRNEAAPKPAIRDVQRWRR